jgi:hypothetical protein
LISQLLGLTFLYVWFHFPGLWADLGSPEHMLMVFTVEPNYRAFLPLYASIVLALIQGLPAEIARERPSLSDLSVDERLQREQVQCNEVSTRLLHLLRQLSADISSYEIEMLPLSDSSVSLAAEVGTAVGKKRKDLVSSIPVSVTTTSPATTPRKRGRKLGTDSASASEESSMAAMAAISAAAAIRSPAVSKQGAQLWPSWDAAAIKRSILIDQIVVNVR